MSFVILRNSTSVTKFNSKLKYKSLSVLLNSISNVTNVFSLARILDSDLDKILLIISMDTSQSVIRNDFPLLTSSKEKDFLLNVL